MAEGKIRDNNHIIEEKSLADIDTFCDFVDNILSHFPPIEDYIDTYPAGYIPSPLWYVQMNRNRGY